MLKKNDEIELYIEDFTSEGSGVGHFEGMAVFVSGAAAGDNAFVHIIKVKSTYAIGKCIKLLKPSKTRIAPDCEYAGSCGGCAFRHISYEAETAMKKKRVEDAFQRIGGINKKLDGFIAAENLTRYRNKAEYPVSFEKELKIGFYALHTHRIIDCRDCVLQPEIFADIVAVIRKWTVEFGISIYNSETGNGLLRHIYIRQGAVSKEIMVCLVINGERIPKEAELVKRLCEIPDIKSIVLNINRLNNNVILGEECKTVYGADCIYDELCGVKIRLSPLSFYQVNHAQAEKLYRKNNKIVKIYCIIKL